MKYRKRPLEVEAIRFDNEFLNSSDSPKWFSDALEVRDCAVGAIRLNDRFSPRHPDSDLDVFTPHGVIGCKRGDWVVKDQFGHLHPYTDEDFRLIFEEVE